MIDKDDAFGLALGAVCVILFMLFTTFAISYELGACKYDSYITLDTNELGYSDECFEAEGNYYCEIEDEFKQVLTFKNYGDTE